MASFDYRWFRTLGHSLQMFRSQQEINRTNRIIGRAVPIDEFHRGPLDPITHQPLGRGPHGLIGKASLHTDPEALLHSAPDEIDILDYLEEHTDFDEVRGVLNITDPKEFKNAARRLLRSGELGNVFSLASADVHRGLKEYIENPPVLTPGAGYVPSEEQMWRLGHLFELWARMQSRAEGPEYTTYAAFTGRITQIKGLLEASALKPSAVENNMRRIEREIEGIKTALIVEYARTPEGAKYLHPRLIEQEEQLSRLRMQFDSIQQLRFLEHEDPDIIKVLQRELSSLQSQTRTLRESAASSRRFRLAAESKFSIWLGGGSVERFTLDNVTDRIGREIDAMDRFKKQQLSQSQEALEALQQKRAKESLLRQQNFFSLLNAGALDVERPSSIVPLGGRFAGMPAQVEIVRDVSEWALKDNLLIQDPGVAGRGNIPGVIVRPVNLLDEAVSLAHFQEVIEPPRPDRPILQSMENMEFGFKHRFGQIATEVSGGQSDEDALQQAQIAAERTTGLVSRYIQSRFVAPTATMEGELSSPARALKDFIDAHTLIPTAEGTPFEVLPSAAKTFQAFLNTSHLKDTETQKILDIVARYQKVTETDIGGTAKFDKASIDHARKNVLSLLEDDNASPVLNSIEKIRRAKTDQTALNVIKYTSHARLFHAAAQNLDIAQRVTNPELFAQELVGAILGGNNNPMQQRWLRLAGQQLDLGEVLRDILLGDDEFSKQVTNILTSQISDLPYQVRHTDPQQLLSVMKERLTGLGLHDAGSVYYSQLAAIRTQDIAERRATLPLLQTDEGTFYAENLRRTAGGRTVERATRDDSLRGTVGALYASRESTDLERRNSDQIERNIVETDEHYKDLRRQYSAISERVNNLNLLESSGIASPQDIEMLRRGKVRQKELENRIRALRTERRDFTDPSPRLLAAIEKADKTISPAYNYLQQGGLLVGQGMQPIAVLEDLAARNAAVRISIPDKEGSALLKVLPVDPIPHGRTDKAFVRFAVTGEEQQQIATLKYLYGDDFMGGDQGIKGYLAAARKSDAGSAIVGMELHRQKITDSIPSRLPREDLLLEGARKGHALNDIRYLANGEVIENGLGLDSLTDQQLTRRFVYGGVEDILRHESPHLRPEQIDSIMNAMVAGAPSGEGIERWVPGRVISPDIGMIKNLGDFKYADVLMNAAGEGANTVTARRQAALARRLERIYRTKAVSRQMSITNPKFFGVTGDAELERARQNVLKGVEQRVQSYLPNFNFEAMDDLYQSFASEVPSHHYFNIGPEAREVMRGLAKTTDASAVLKFGPKQEYLYAPTAFGNSIQSTATGATTTLGQHFTSLVSSELIKNDQVSGAVTDVWKTLNMKGTEQNLVDYFRTYMEALSHSKVREQIPEQAQEILDKIMNPIHQPHFDPTYHQDQVGRALTRGKDLDEVMKQINMRTIKDLWSGYSRRRKFGIGGLSGLMLAAIGAEILHSSRRDRDRTEDELAPPASMPDYYSSANNGNMRIGGYPRLPQLGGVSYEIHGAPGSDPQQLSQQMADSGLPVNTTVYSRTQTIPDARKQKQQQIEQNYS